MKFFMRVLMCVVLCMASLGVRADSLSDNSVTDIARLTAVSERVDNDMDTTEYDALLERVRQIDPGLATKVEKDAGARSVSAKIVLLRSYLAEKSFEYYKSKLLSDLKQRSKETGRKIKSGETVGGYGYWMDRGDIDQEKCRNDDGWLICHYPQDFEEFEVIIDIDDGWSVETAFSACALVDSTDKRCDTLNVKKIQLTKGLPTTGEWLICDIELVRNSSANLDDENLLESWYLMSGCRIYDYGRYMAWLNQMVTDTLHGKNDIVSVEKLPEGSPFGEYVYVPRSNLDPGSWKSNTVPGHRYIGSRSSGFVSVK